MEVVYEPNIVGDYIKVFLDNPHWPKHIKDPELKQIKSCSLKYIENNIFKYSYYASCPRSEIL